MVCLLWREAIQDIAVPCHSHLETVSVLSAIISVLSEGTRNSAWKVIIVKKCSIRSESVKAKAKDKHLTSFSLLVLLLPLL